MARGIEVRSRPDRMILRWTALTNTGRNLRMYANNRLEIAKRLRPGDEKLVVAIEAGCWHEFSKLGRAEWDATALVEGRRAPGA